MKKFIVWFFVVGYCLLPVWLKTPVVGGDLAVFFVLGPPFFAALYLLFVWLPNSTYEPRGYSRYDIDNARHDGIQQGRRGG